MQNEIEIYLNGNTPDVKTSVGGKQCEDPTALGPKHPCVRGGNRIDWFAANNRYWVIVFQTSPFQDGRRILTGRGMRNSDGGPVHGIPGPTAFKYWLLCEDNSVPAKLVGVDPKIVISDEGGIITPPGAARYLVEDLGRLADDAEAIAAAARALRASASVLWVDGNGGG